MQDTIQCITAVQREHDITAVSLLNYVMSDGVSLIATRFVCPISEAPASLYYAGERRMHSSRGYCCQHRGLERQIYCYFAVAFACHNQGGLLVHLNDSAVHSCR